VYERSSEKLSIERLKVRTKPETVALILKEVQPLQLTRQIPYVQIMFRINRAVKSVLDRLGIAGGLRPGYYAYSKSLWKFLSKYTENVWDRYIDAVTRYYIEAHQLNPKILDEVASVTVKTIREIVSEVVGGGGGGEKTGDSDSGEAVGEAKRD
jgi:hypothetical protein